MKRLQAQGEGFFLANGGIDNAVSRQGDWCIALTA